MKIGFIGVLFCTPEAEIKKIKQEIKKLNIKDSRSYFIDNSNDNIGYAGGVNKGIKQGLKDGVDLFVILNTDISFSSNFSKKLFDGKQEFDVWGGTMIQNNKTYYGGEIDKRRMSGGLITKKPDTRFTQTDFVSGACMIIPRQTIEKIGLLDESYFMYYEDVEYCTRARRNSLRVGIDTELIYTHFEKNESWIKKDWFLAKNRIKFLLKYGSPTQKLWEIPYAPKTIWFLAKGLLKPRLFLTNFLSMNTSSVINKILSFLLFINLVRILSPVDYGSYTFVWAHVALLIPILDLGTTTYSMVSLPTDKKSAFFDIFSLRIMLSFIIFCATILLAYFFHYESHLILFIALTGAVIFANSMSGSFLIVSSLRQKLIIPSIVSVLFQLCIVMGLTILLFLQTPILSLFVTICILYLTYAIVNGILIYHYFNGQITLRFVPSTWASIIRKSYIYVLIIFFGALYYGIDIFLLKFLKGVETVGTYSAGYKFFDAFMFITAGYTFSALPSLARLKNSNIQLFKHKIKRDSLFLFLLGVLICIAVWLFAPLFLPLILKGSYTASIQVLMIVIIALPLLLASTVLFNAMYLYNKQKWVIVLFISQTLLNVALNIIFIPVYSFYASAWITVLCEVINILILLYFIYYVTKHDHTR